MSEFRGFARAQYDHTGIIVDTKPEGAVFVEATRVWVTSPRADGNNVEWLYFEPDTPVTGPVRDMPHVAYRVLDLEAACEDLDEILLEPFDSAPGFVRAAFGLYQGAVIELMEYADPEEEGWFQ